MCPLLRGVFAGREDRAAASAMQNYKYDKAIVPESKNGGSPALNNNPRKGGSKRALLICLDLFCLFLGERSPAVPWPLCPAAPRPLGAGPSPAGCLRAGLGTSSLARGRPAAASPGTTGLSAPGGPRCVSGLLRSPSGRLALSLPDPTDGPACT